MSEFTKCDERGCKSTRKEEDDSPPHLWRFVVYNKKGKGKKQGPTVAKDFCPKCSKKKGI